MTHSLRVGHREHAEEQLIVVGQSGGGWGSIALAVETRRRLGAVITLRRGVAVESMASRSRSRTRCCEQQGARTHALVIYGR